MTFLQASDITPLTPLSLLFEEMIKRNHRNFINPDASDWHPIALANKIKENTAIIQHRRPNLRHVIKRKLADMAHLV